MIEVGFISLSSCESLSCFRYQSECLKEKNSSVADFGSLSFAEIRFLATTPKLEPFRCAHKLSHNQESLISNLQKSKALVLPVATRWRCRAKPVQMSVLLLPCDSHRCQLPVAVTGSPKPPSTHIHNSAPLQSVTRFEGNYL